MKHSTPPHGFTLVELLVVVAIISILAAMLLPALEAARKEAIQAQCVSQCRQVGFTLTSIAGDRRGLFPEHTVRHPMDVSNTSLREAFLSYAGTSHIFYCPAAPFSSYDVIVSRQPVAADDWPDNSLNSYLLAGLHPEGSHRFYVGLTTTRYAFPLRTSCEPQDVLWADRAESYPPLSMGTSTVVGYGAHMPDSDCEGSSVLRADGSAHFNNSASDDFACEIKRDNDAYFFW